MLCWSCLEAAFRVFTYEACFVTELGLARYKYMVQVVIGEQKGEGVRYAFTQPAHASCR